MKVMLLGCLHGANFGDTLFAHLFYERCRIAGFQEVDFFSYRYYGIGSFCRKELGYTVKKRTLESLRADALVLISGGFLWNDKNLIYDAKMRFRRYILPALLFLFLQKPVYILGVGGGPVDTIWLRKIMVGVLNRSAKIYFRDDETRTIFQAYGVKSRMETTADTALILKSEMLAFFEEKTTLDELAGERKRLLFHLPDGIWENKCVYEIIIPGLLQFLKGHPEYYLILSHDDIRSRGQEEKFFVEKIREQLSKAGIEFYEYKYHDCMQMCSLINEMDCIVTEKLHVGVVGCALDKCVVAFPCHREKTDNFYRSIGEPERCVNVRVLDIEKVKSQLEIYHNKPVHLSDELRARAEKNLSAVDDIASHLI